MSSSDDFREVARVGRDPAAPAAAPRASVAIGFGSPSQDSGVTRLDLNEVLIRHPQASFLMRAAGDSMRGAGIEPGCLLLVDRAITPVHGHIVIAAVGGEFVCRRLVKQGLRLCLQAAEPGVPDIVPEEGSEWQVWGVVTHAIQAMPV
jgi:DNA polymerase V